MKMLLDNGVRTTWSGAIIEISLSVGVIPPSFHLDMRFWPSFSVYIHKNPRSLFKEFYLLYFVQNFAYIIAFDRFEDVK